MINKAEFLILKCTSKYTFECKQYEKQTWKTEHYRTSGSKKRKRNDKNTKTDQKSNQRHFTENRRNAFFRGIT